MTYNGVKTWTNEPLTAADMNTYLSDNIDALKNPPSKIYNANESANYTTTSTTFTNVDATDTEGKFRLTITTTGGAILVTAMLTITNNTTNATVHFALSVDGTVYAPTGAIEDGICASKPNVGANTNMVVPIVYWIYGQSAGSHIIRLMWKITTASTATLFAGAGTAGADVHPQFAVMELGNFS